jgi:hypothetical protein
VAIRCLSLTGMPTALRACGAAPLPQAGALTAHNAPSVYSAPLPRAAPKSARGTPCGAPAERGNAGKRLSARTGPRFRTRVRAGFPRPTDRLTGRSRARRWITTPGDHAVGEVGIFGRPILGREGGRVSSGRDGRGRDSGSGGENRCAITIEWDQPLSAENSAKSRFSSKTPARSLPPRTKRRGFTPRPQQDPTLPSQASKTSARGKALE